MTTQYVEFDPKQGYPTGPDLAYECQRCHKIIPSMPQSNIWCDCYNLCVDVDAGRLAVKDDSLLKLLRIENDNGNEKLDEEKDGREETGTLKAPD